MLGLVGFAAQIPTFIASPVAGVLTDRWNRHRTLLLTQSLAMIHALVMAVLAVTGLITVWQIVLLAVVLGLINAFDMPTRQAFLIDMIEDRAHLGNAIALNSSMFNGARLIGPSLAGFLIALWGEGACFLLNAVSYVAVLIALGAMRVPPRTANAKAGRILHGLKEGVAYAFGFPPIRTILLLVALVSLTAMPLAVLMPVLAGDVLHGGPGTLGLLTAASGLGALAGAVLGVAQEHRRTRPVDGRDDWAVGRGHCCRRVLHEVGTLAGAAELDGLRHDRSVGRQQHHPANHCRRGQTGPGDELLYHGVHGHGAAGKPIGRRTGQQHRHAVDAGNLWTGLPRRSAGLCGPTVRAAEDHPAHLCPGGCASRHLVGDSIRRTTGRPARRLTRISCRNGVGGFSWKLSQKSALSLWESGRGRGLRGLHGKVLMFSRQPPSP